MEGFGANPAVDDLGRAIQGPEALPGPRGSAQRHIDVERGTSKSGLFRRELKKRDLEQEFLRAQGRVSDDELHNLVRSMEARGLDPWDVHLHTETGQPRNVMLHEGRAAVIDPGAVRRDVSGQFAERGGTFIDPEVIDVTRAGRLAGVSLQDVLMDMIWDPITAATGHRARTRAAVAGMEPGMYGKVMPYIAPVIPPSLRMSRPLLGTEEEEPDVLGAL